MNNNLMPSSTTKLDLTEPAPLDEMFARLALAKALSDHFKKIYDEQWELAKEHISAGSSREASVNGVNVASVQLTKPPSPTFSVDDPQAFEKACEKAGVRPPLIRHLAYDVTEPAMLLEVLENWGLDPNDYGVVCEEVSLASWADTEFFATAFDEVPDGISIKQGSPSRRVKMNPEGVSQLLGRFNTEKFLARLTS